MHFQKCGCGWKASSRSGGREVSSLNKMIMKNINVIILGKRHLFDQKIYGSYVLRCIEYNDSDLGVRLTLRSLEGLVVDDMFVAVERGGRGGKSSSSRDLDDDGQEDGRSRLRSQMIPLPLVARDGQLNCNVVAEGLLT